MGVVQLLSSFALRQFVGDGSNNLVQTLSEHAGDASQRLLAAIRRANERAWKALEIALVGETLWSRLERAEDRAFRAQVRTFLDALPLPELVGKTEFRTACLDDVRQARRRGLLLSGVVAEELTDSAGRFARFTDPGALLEVEREALAGLATEVERAGHLSLAWLLRQPAQPGQSLIVIAVRYFFRREIDADSVLSRRLAQGQTEQLTRAQQEGFERLDAALAEHGDRMTELLDDVRDAVRELSSQMAEVLERLRPNPQSAIRNPQSTTELDLLPLLRRFVPQDDLHLAPDIPPKKLATARRTCQVPGDEVIVALIDATVTGTARAALLLGRRGLYYHNEHGAKVAGCGQIPYADFASRKIVRESWAEVSLDRGEFFNRAGSQLSAERLVELLSAVQALL